MYNNFEGRILDYISAVDRLSRTRPLILGGIASSGGGTGYPPGGVVGYLPQTRVAYDFSEDETYAPVVSGYSLLDNLNRIRFRINSLEGGVGGSVVILNDGVEKGTATDLDFSECFDVTLSSGVALIENLGIGIRVFNEDLSSQIPGSGFSTGNNFSDGTLRVHYNGIREADINITTNSSFFTNFQTYTGDEVLVDYYYLESDQ